MTTFTSSDLSTAAVLFVTVPGIAFGGHFLLRVAGGSVPATVEQRNSFRAGHAHAGVLVMLALVALVWARVGDVHGRPGWIARTLIPLAPILIPAGFFLSMIGAGRTRPNRLVLLVHAGAVALAVGTLTLGIALFP